MAYEGAPAGAAGAAGPAGPAGACGFINNECSICCEKFNQSIHSRIICDYGDCKYSEACKACVRHYILNSSADPHCMKCNKAWSQKFLVDNLNKSYISKEFKAHKKQFLLEREISKLPETMEAAQKYKQIVLEEQKQKTLLSEIIIAKHALARLNDKLNESRVNVFNIKQHSGVVVEHKTFIMPCPNNDCRGYLSTQYKCQLCNLQTCSKCLEIMGHSKDAEHVCKVENVQTAELIKKETKGCPCCGTRIFKISGCDQMWCTKCNKAFSWKTGKIETGIVHNPHFYEYQRKNNGGIAPRNPGDNPCGELCSWYQMNNLISNKLIGFGNMEDKCKTLRKDLGSIHRSIAHITAVDLRIIRNKITAVSNSEQIRIDYIVKKLSKEEMATKIYRNNALRQKYTEILNIMELLITVGIDFFETLIMTKLSGDAFVDYVFAKVDEFHKLRLYCNEQFEIISYTYSQMVPHIDKLFSITNKKYSVKKTPKAAAAKGKVDDDDHSDTTSQMVDDDYLSDEM